MQTGKPRLSPEVTRATGLGFEVILLNSQVLSCPLRESVQITSELAGSEGAEAMEARDPDLPFASREFVL